MGKKKFSQTKLKIAHESTNTMSNRANPDTFIGELDKVRRVQIMLYAPPTEWGSLLKKAEHYAYIYHDKDIKEDGSPKTPHYHLLLVFKNQRTVSAMLKDTNIPNLTTDTTFFAEKMLKPHCMFRYLAHDTPTAIAENKHRYPYENIVTNDIGFWLEDTSKQEANEIFIQDLTNNQMTHRDLALKYGRDYIRNCTKYNDFANLLQREDLRLLNFQKTQTIIKEFAFDGELSVISDNPYMYDLGIQKSDALELVADYLADICLETYYIEKQYSSTTSPSSVTRETLAKLTDTICRKVLDKFGGVRL